MKRIYVAGHRGMVGQAVCRRLERVPVKILTRTHEQLDLTSQSATETWFGKSKIDTVVFCAARVGGILANSKYPAQFLFDNLAMATNAIEASRRHGVERFVFLGSTCVYPRNAAQPMDEGALMTGPLEATNEAYAIAKISGIKLCQAYRSQYGLTYHSLMPTNLYGPGDTYDQERAHVIPALIDRILEAERLSLPEVTIWGTGRPRRDFLHVDDLADAIWHVLQIDDPPDLVNVGTSEGRSIREVAETIKRIAGYEGELTYDGTKPDGTPHKVTDIRLLQWLGWMPLIDFEQGIARTIADRQNQLSRPNSGA